MQVHLCKAHVQPLYAFRDLSSERGQWKSIKLTSISHPLCSWCLREVGAQWTQNVSMATHLLVLISSDGDKLRFRKRWPNTPERLKSLTSFGHHMDTRLVLVEAVKYNLQTHGTIQKAYAKNGWLYEGNTCEHCCYIKTNFSPAIQSFRKSKNIISLHHVTLQRIQGVVIAKHRLEQIDDEYRVRKANLPLTQTLTFSVTSKCLKTQCFFCNVFL